MGAISTRLDLITNAAVTGGSYEWPGGKGVFFAEGTWSSATVSLEMQTPQETWINVGTATDLTANSVASFELPQGRIRAAVTGTPSGIYAHAILTRK